MKIKFSLLTLIALVFVLSGCKKDEEQPPIIPGEITNLSTDKLAFTNVGETHTITFTSNTNWKLLIEDTEELLNWIEFSELLGEAGDVELKVKARENSRNEKRTGEFKISTSEDSHWEIVTIEQESLAKTSFRIVQPTFHMSEKSGQINILVEGSLKPEFESLDSWITFVDSREWYEGWYVYTFNLASMAEESRTGKIAFFDKNKPDRRRYAVVNQIRGVVSDGTVREVVKSSKPSPIKIVVLGDGFQMDHNKDGGFFEESVNRYARELFQVEPFASYKDYFSVYTVYSNSIDSGADVNPDTEEHNTVFQTTYNFNYIADRCIFPKNNSLVYLYAELAAPGFDAVAMIVNDFGYGGCSDGQYVGVSTLHEIMTTILTHELGHVFTLADEYVDPAYVDATGITLDYAAQQPNVDITNDPTKIKWKHFLGREGYEMEGIHEGGFYFEKGVWRPTKASIMGGGLKLFNAISRETIVRLVLDKSGEAFDFDDFLVKDQPALSQWQAYLNSNKGPRAGVDAEQKFFNPAKAKGAWEYPSTRPRFRRCPTAR